MTGLLAGLLTALLAVVGLALVTPSPTYAAGPAVTVVTTQQTFATATGTLTVACPAGQHALDGGAAPVAPVPSASQFVLNENTPVGSTGAQVDGQVPTGWSATFSSRNASSAVGTWSVYATCSADASVIMRTASGFSIGTVAVDVPCLSGQRAVGGGLALSAGSSGGLPQIKLSGPHVDGNSNTFGNDADGSQPVVWQVNMANASASMIAIAVCANDSDATMIGAPLTVAAGDGTQAGTAAPACPSGQVAVGAGLAGSNSDAMRVGYAQPDVAALHSWTVQGAGGTTDLSYRAYAVCVTGAYTPPTVSPPPPRPDTTPPGTRLEKTPAKKTPARKAKFTFTTQPAEAGATFTCALDAKPATPCTSPYQAKKLKPGKHKLTVTAIDAAGNADPTPAVFKWKVVKKKPKR